MEIRDIDNVFMDIRRNSGSMSSIVMTQAKLTLKLLVFLMRLAKKGFTQKHYVEDLEKFIDKTEGHFTIYNIPLNEKSAKQYEKNVTKIRELEESMTSLKGKKKEVVQKQIDEIKKDMPELQELERLGVKSCVLPTVNGIDNILQVAVDNNDSPLFKGWYTNHILQNLSGGQKTVNEMRAFTEGNHTLVNLPFEGESLNEALNDFDKLFINYSILPDLNVGDGYTQMYIANVDVDKVSSWFEIYKTEQLEKGQKVSDLETISVQHYIDSGEINTDTYINQAEPEVKEINNKFSRYAANSESIHTVETIGKENSEAFIRFSNQPEVYDKITINADTLVTGPKANIPKELTDHAPNSFFCRIPGTYSENQKNLVLPNSQVFEADGGKTYIAFIPKNQETLIVTNDFTYENVDFNKKYKGHFEDVSRTFGKTESLSQNKKMEQLLTQSYNPKNKFNRELIKIK